MVKNLPALQETWVQSLDWENPLEKGITPVFLPGEFHGQRSWWATVHGFAKSQTQLREFHSLYSAWQDKRLESLFLFIWQFSPFTFESMGSGLKFIFALFILCEFAFL